MSLENRRYGVKLRRNHANNYQSNKLMIKWPFSVGETCGFNEKAMLCMPRGKL